MTTALINWDALVVSLTSLALLAWSRRRPGWAGVWLGLGIAAKLYPLLLLVPLTALCLHAGRIRALLVTVGATVGSWAAVNLPVYVVAPEGWRTFWEFNADRGADLGSIWYVLKLVGHPVEDLSLWIAALMVAGAMSIGALLVLAPRRPRLAQGVFLIIALFLLVNKVYSPQYVLWLLPLLVLARPCWLDWSVFSIAELVYFAAVWGHLGDSGFGSQEQHYCVAVLLRIGVQLWLCSRVIRDAWKPTHDAVRIGGLDDPDGGLLNGAPDFAWLPANEQRLAR